MEASLENAIRLVLMSPLLPRLSMLIHKLCSGKHCVFHLSRPLRKQILQDFVSLKSLTQRIQIEIHSLGKELIKYNLHQSRLTGQI